MLRRLLARFADPASLKGRTLKGGAVALAGFGAAQILRLGSNLVMTRLLAPDAFGLMGVAMALQVWVAMMSDLGLETSVMRSKHGADPDFLATARTVQIGRCALIALILIIAGLSLQPLAAAGAFPASSVFADPRLPFFIHCIAASVTIYGLSPMRIALYNRALNLAPVMRLEIAAQISAIAAMIGAALAGLGVYALAVGAVVAEAFKVLGSYWLLKGPPSRFGWNRAHFDEIFSFGKWLLVASFFGFLANRGDQIIFGWLFTLGEYSFYSIGLLWVLTGRTIIETVQKKVAYPAIAELHRERPQDLTRIYRRMRLVYEAACLAIFLGVVFLSDFAIALLYPDNYQGVAHYMKLLSVLLLIVPFRLLSVVTLTGGDSRRFTIVTVLPGLALFCLTPFVYRWFGRDAAIVFAALTPLVAQPFNWKFASKYIKIDYARECVMIVVAVAAAGLVLRFA